MKNIYKFVKYNEKEYLEYLNNLNKAVFGKDIIIFTENFIKLLRINELELDNNPDNKVVIRKLLNFNENKSKNDIKIIKILSISEISKVIKYGYLIKYIKRKSHSIGISLDVILHIFMCEKVLKSEDKDKFIEEIKKIINKIDYLNPSINIEYFFIIIISHINEIDINNFNKNIKYLTINFILKLKLSNKVDKNKLIDELIKVNKNYKNINRYQYVKSIKDVINKKYHTKVWRGRDKKNSLKVETLKLLLEKEDILYTFNNLFREDDDKLNLYFEILIELGLRDNISLANFEYEILLRTNNNTKDKEEILQILTDINNFISILKVFELITEEKFKFVDPKDNKPKEYIVFHFTDNTFFKQLVMQIEVGENYNVFLSTDSIKLSSYKIFKNDDKIEIILNKEKFSFNKKYLKFLEIWIIGNEIDYLKYIHNKKEKTERDEIIISTEFNKVNEYINNIKKDENYFKKACIKHKEDFRGRVYAIRTPFSYIGSKFLRPLYDLLEWRENDEKIIKIYVVEIFNEIFSINMKRYDEVCDFRDTLSINEILELKSDLKWYVIYFKLNDYKINHFECDCKCSGYQHAAGLLKNEKVLSLVGLNGEENYEDFYNHMIKMTFNNLNTVIKFNKILKIEGIDVEDLIKEEEKELDNILKKYDINKRALFKKIVITFLYGATDNTIIKNINDYIKNNVDKDIISPKDNIYLQEIISKIVVIFKDVFIKTMFDKDLINKRLGILIFLRTKDPIIFGKKYVGWYNKKVTIPGTNKILINGHKKWIRGNFKLNSLDYDKCVKTSLVNTIHSLDAIYIKKIILKHQNNNVFSIHDCLLIKPGDIETYKNESKEIFKEIYNQNLIEQFINRIEFDFTDEQGLLYDKKGKVKSNIQEKNKYQIKFDKLIIKSKTNIPHDKEIFRYYDKKIFQKREIIEYFNRLITKEELIKYCISSIISQVGDCELKPIDKCFSLKLS